MIKKTAQTRFIMDLLKSRRVHLSAEEVYQTALTSLPYITRATVYNVLNRLVQAGEIKALKVRKDHTVFDGETYPHPHFVCVRCGSIEDVEVEGFDNFARKVLDDFDALDVELTISGVCKQCKSRT